MSLWRSVHFTFRDHVPEVRKKLAARMLQELGEECGGRAAGILHWIAGPATSARGVHLQEIVCFEDEAAKERFRQHPSHSEFVELIKKIADWTWAESQSN